MYKNDFFCCCSSFTFYWTIFYVQFFSYSNSKKKKKIYNIIIYIIFFKQRPMHSKFTLAIAKKLSIISLIRYQSNVLDTVLKLYWLVFLIQSHYSCNCMLIYFFYHLSLSDIHFSNWLQEPNLFSLFFNQTHLHNFFFILIFFYFKFSQFNLSNLNARLDGCLHANASFSRWTRGKF